MTQTTEVPGKPEIDTDLAVREAMKATIRTMKIHVKKDAEELRLLKFCRRTKRKVHSSRAALMLKFKCDDGADVSREIWRRKHQATVRLIAYGRLRNKAHLKDESSWDGDVKELIKSYAPMVQW